MSKTEIIPALTSETAILILNKTLDELQAAENAQKIEEARNTVGNEMLKMMQLVFPIVMQIQVDVLADFGFPEGREGAIRFAQMLRGIEREDSEVARLHGLVKAYYLPPVAVNAVNEVSGDEKVQSS